MKRIALPVALVLAVSTLIVGAITARVTWTLNPPSEAIQAYCVSYRHESTTNWTEVLRPATNSSLLLNLPTGGVWYFKGCASNQFGLGPEIQPVTIALPTAMRDFKVTVQLTYP